MLLTHQTIVRFTKSQKYFCVQWQKFIQGSLTLFSFDLGGPNTQLSIQSGLKLET